MDQHSSEPKKDGDLREPDSVPVQPRRVWETPALEELSVQLSAAEPRFGRDGSTPFPDCTHS
jgi:hypothetical protein